MGQRGPGAPPPSLWHRTVSPISVDGTDHLSQFRVRVRQSKRPSPLSLPLGAHPSSWSLKIRRSRWGQVPLIAFCIPLSVFPFSAPHTSVCFLLQPSLETALGNISKIFPLPQAAHTWVFIWRDRLKEFEAGLFPDFKLACLTPHFPGASSRACFSDSAPDWLPNLDFLEVQVWDLPPLYSLPPVIEWSSLLPWLLVPSTCWLAHR